MKRMHDTMWSALTPAETNQTPRELEMASEMHKNELIEQKERHAAVIQSLQRQIEEANLKNSEYEIQIRELESTPDNSNEMNNQFDIINNEKRELESSLKHMESEKMYLFWVYLLHLGD